MAKAKRRELTALERRIIRAAQDGDIKAFCDALLEHPEDGRLLRTLALEEQALEWHEVMRCIKEMAKARMSDGGTGNQNRHP